jgi:hypothetical protein
MKKTILSILLIVISFSIEAQIQTGVWRSINSNTDYHHFIRNGGGSAVYINQADTSNPILTLSSGNTTANQGVKLTVKNDGSVGIGTLTTDTHKLAVNGTISSGTIYSTSFKSKNTNTDYHHFIRNGGGAAVYVNQSSNESDKAILRLSSGSDIANQGVKFTVENNGSVGIGTINPGIWKLAVNGNIRAKEIKVETGWSDFVFYKDYKLPTLSEVENHIKEKGHLKDIPSAKEVEKNGIFLGEMDSKLLQKIEELTLYAIEQEKKIKELESLNDKLLELQSRLEKLESEK